MDGNMPRMTGGQAVIAMKEMGYAYPIVGLTALVGQDVRGVWVVCCHPNGVHRVRRLMRE